MKRTSIEDICTVDRADPAAVDAPDGVVVGRLVALDRDGRPLVEYPRNGETGPLPAVATRPYEETEIGCEVALVFAEGDLTRPVLIGPLMRPEPLPKAREAGGTRPEADIRTEDGVTTITAGSRLVLRCGAASVTLTRAGKVLIRGKYLLSRSSGVNRIKGGSIQLN